MKKSLMMGFLLANTFFIHENAYAQKSCDLYHGCPRGLACCCSDSNGNQICCDSSNCLPPKTPNKK